MKLQANFIVFERIGSATSLQKIEVNRNPLTLQILDGQKIGTSEMVDFVERHNHLLVNSLDKSNFRRLGRTGKPLIIAIVDYSTEQSRALIEYLDEAASLLSMEESHEFVFGHMDGVRFTHYLERYRVSPNALLVLDLSINGYYVLGTWSKETVVETVKGAQLKNLKYIELEPVDLGILGRAMWKLKYYYPWSLLSVLPAVFLILSFLFPHPNSIKQKKF